MHEFYDQQLWYGLCLVYMVVYGDVGDEMNGLCLASKLAIGAHIRDMECVWAISNS